MTGAVSGEESIHLMHHFGRKCDRCGIMTWPGMPGAAKRWTWDEDKWKAAVNNCSRPTQPTSVQTENGDQ